MNTFEALAWIILAILLIVMAYGLLGLPMPFSTGRRERGEPLCGHPFEQAYEIVGGEITHPDVFTCPKCGTAFEVRNGHWRMVSTRP